ncbi:MAG TPA: glycogen debranching N-terminal domain-containing protein, partial [Gaiellaceae bacterium]|nr:glycogen debranching N-terminal domain-containing protein [Gaiellaceae bacterium]
MTDGLVQSLDGNTFVVSDRRGDIEASATDPGGLFAWDTRFLSRWVLTVNGQRLTALSTDDLNYFEARFFLVPGSNTVYVDANLTVIRQRVVGDGFRERVSLLNHQGGPVEVAIRIDAGCDFADLFEVKDALAKQGTYSTKVDDGTLVMSYHRDTFHRATTVSSTAPPARVDDAGLEFEVRIEPHGSWSTELRVRPTTVRPGARGTPTTASQRAGEGLDRLEELNGWLAAAPRLVADSDSLAATYRRSLVDLAALRFSPVIAGTRSLPAAGLPWFMTMFGRDSIFTSLQAMPFAPELAATTLRVLGDWQGSRVDDFRDEDPGRILHEMRYGELTAFQERPHSPYYGSVDATPLWIVLLDEYERWTGDSDLVREFESEARAALHWIDAYADLQGNGYIAYQRRNEKTGLENQCWKDSWDSISYQDGRLPGFPRATCELQGYAFDAKVRAARLARRFWNDPGYADELERQAADLKERFDRDFWIDDGEYYALALDADGTRVDSLSSNIGHLLWSGIVDDAKRRGARLARTVWGDPELADRLDKEAAALKRR